MTAKQLAVLLYQIARWVRHGTDILADGGSQDTLVELIRSLHAACDVLERAP